MTPSSSILEKTVVSVAEVAFSAARIAANASIDDALDISERIVMNIVDGGDVTGEPMIVSRFGARAISSCGGREDERRRARGRAVEV
jgi:hypothetical protein